MWIKPLERIHPDNTSWIYKGTINQHIKRYQFALSEGVGTKVLDIACGTGYGSNILAKSASQVIGIDISNEAIESAKKEFVSPKIIFQQGDASQIEFPDNTFDTIISFETIEHLPIDKVESYLKELARVLKSNGEIYISSPDIMGFSLGEISSNHFHVQEFTTKQFINLVSKHFKIEKIVAQESTSMKIIQSVRWIACKTNSKAVQKMWRAYKTLINCTGELVPYKLEDSESIPYIVIVKAKKI